MITKEEKNIDNILGQTEEFTHDPSMKEDLELLNQCYEAMAMADGSAPNVEEAWQQLKYQRRHRSMHRIIGWAVGTAAAVVALLVMLTHAWTPGEELLYSALPNQDSIVIRVAAHGERMPIMQTESNLSASHKQQYKTVVVPEHQDYHLMLSDGTEVWLNAGTRFTYPEQFTNAERMVSIEGEAYFQVAHNASQPFVVQAGDLRTVVTGTQFDVRNYAGEAPRVTLVEGSVTVHGGGMALPMAPGEGAILEQSKLQVRQTDIEANIAWRDGLLYFQEASLRDILTAMGRWYNMNVVCIDKAEIQHHYHFACDRKGSPATAVSLLRTVTGENVYIKDNTIYVHK